MLYGEEADVEEAPNVANAGLADNVEENVDENALEVGTDYQEEQQAQVNTFLLIDLSLSIFVQNCRLRTRRLKTMVKMMA